MSEFEPRTFHLFTFKVKFQSTKQLEKKENKVVSTQIIVVTNYKNNVLRFHISSKCIYNYKIKISVHVFILATKKIKK
jgi:hypothetical protein